VTVKEIPDDTEEMKVQTKDPEKVESFYSANASLPEKSDKSGLMSRASGAIRVKKFSPDGNLSELTL
jgi:hypothetical protein